MEGLRNLMESIDGPRVVAVETKVEDAVAAVLELAGCIQAVAAGGTWMETEVVRDPDLLLRMGRSALTPRELQVVDLVERGYKNKEIGLTLGIRTGTVKIHLKHIFEKTGIRGRYGLAISGLRNKGLLVAAV